MPRGCKTVRVKACSQRSRADLCVAVRVEYLRARARAMRYREQVCLIQEEKRRVLVSLERTALLWDARAIVGESPEQQGLTAYAAKQAAVHRRLKAKFTTQWSAATGDSAADPPVDGDSPGAEDDDPLLISDDDDGFGDAGSDEESDGEM